MIFLRQTWDMKNVKRASSKMIHHFMNYCLKKEKRLNFIFVYRDGILWMVYYKTRTWSCNIFWLIPSLIYFKIFFSNSQWEKYSSFVFYSAQNSIKNNRHIEASSIVEICFALPWQFHHKKKAFTEACKVHAILYCLIIIWKTTKPQTEYIAEGCEIFQFRRLHQQ